MNKIIGIIFTLIYIALALFLALWLLFVGATLILYFAAGYLVVAIAVLWWIHLFVKRREFKHSPTIFLLSGLGIGFLLFGAVIASEWVFVELESIRMEKHTANTEVFNMKDDTLFSSKENPIGIRLRYSMRFPDNNNFFELPAMRPEKNIISTWSDMRIAKQTIEPPMVGTNSPRYESGIIYNFTVDMIPSFILQKTKPCIVQPPAGYTKELQNSEPVRFTITVSGTKYSGFTSNTYSLRLFYENAVKEGASECQENQTL